MMILFIIAVSIPFILFFLWAIFLAEVIDHNYYYVATKSYETLLHIKNNYEITKSIQIYHNFYDYKDEAFKHISSLYIRDISLLNKIKIGRILKKISKIQLDITLMNIKKGE